MSQAKLTTLQEFTLTEGEARKYYEDSGECRAGTWVLRPLRSAKNINEVLLRRHKRLSFPNDPNVNEASTGAWVPFRINARPPKVAPARKKGVSHRQHFKELADNGFISKETLDVRLARETLYEELDKFGRKIGHTPSGREVVVQKGRLAANWPKVQAAKDVLTATEKVARRKDGGITGENSTFRHFDQKVLRPRASYFVDKPYYKTGLKKNRYYIEEDEVLSVYSDDEPIDQEDSDSEPDYWNVDGSQVLATAIANQPPRKITGRGGPRRSKLNNRGTGGKSKVQRPALPPVGVDAEQAILVGDNINADEISVDSHSTVSEPGDRLPNPYVAKSPLVKKLFEGPGLPEGWFATDVVGDPYCGEACLCVATDTHFDAKTLANDLNGNDPTIEYGEIHNLSRRASKYGVNVAVYNSNLVPLIVTCHSTAWKWVIMMHNRSDEQLLNGRIVPNGEIAEDDDVGHYNLIVQPVATPSGFTLPATLTTKTDLISLFRKRKFGIFAGVIFGGAVVVASHFILGRFRPSHTFRGPWSNVINSTMLVLTPLTAWCGLLRYCTDGIYEEVVRRGTFADPSDVDRRSVIDRRDAIHHQDDYSLYETNVYTKFFFGKFRVSLNFMLPPNYRQLLVSNVRAAQTMTEMQALAGSGRDPELAKPTISRLREVNTNIALPNVFYDTYRWCDIYARSLHWSFDRYNPTAGLIQLNAPNVEAIIPNFDIVQQNQLLGMGRKRPYTHITSLDITKKSKRNVPVAVAPIGVPITARGKLSAGLIGVTDAPGVLAALAGRALTKDFSKVDDAFFNDYASYTKKYFDRALDTIDVSNLDHKMLKSPIATYVYHNTGKKSATVIKDIITKYRRYRAGRMTSFERRQFEMRGAFVKLESNVKHVVVDGEDKIKGRPRNIFTMSPLMSVELSPLLSYFPLVYKAFGYNDKHVKIDPSEMIARVMEVTRNFHMVTDASSFEASLDMKFREIHDYIIISLCERIGDNQTLRNFLKFENQPAPEYQTHGLKFKLGTLGSGMYWTGFQNWIMMTSLNVYLCYLEGIRVDAVFEGDDGIIGLPLTRGKFDEISARWEINMTRLGIKFSSNLSGTENGDVDFLRKRFVGGKMLLNIGRSMNVFWVMRGANLASPKQLFLLRCKGLSLHHLSPGHPILWAIVLRIGYLTRSVNYFRTAKHFLDCWKIKEEDIHGKYPRELSCDESLRPLVADGALGFPPIPIHVQLILEERILDFTKDIYFGNLLNDYPEINDAVLADKDSGSVDHSINSYVSLVEFIKHCTTVGRVTIKNSHLLQETYNYYYD